MAGALRRPLRIRYKTSFQMTKEDHYLTSITKLASLMVEASNCDTPVRVLSFIKKDPKITAEEFQRYWREIHAPKSLEYMRKYGVLFYSQIYTTKADKDSVNYALFEGTATTLEYDGIATVVFRSMEGAKACWRDPGYINIMQEDAEFLTQGEQMCISSGEERVIMCT